MGERVTKWLCRRLPDNGGAEFVPIYASAVVSERRGPYVKEDTMEATLHPCDGKYYDSKSTFEKVTKAHGCHTVGNEWQGKRFHPSEKPPPGRKEALIEAYKAHKEGYRPPPTQTVSARELESFRRWDKS